MNILPSKGEQKIINILTNEKIPFEREKIFPDFKNARYDFFLPKDNIIIEYDGIQHFKQYEFFSKTRSDFLKRQEKDRKKNSYALAHGYKMFRIPEWEFQNINKSLDIFQEKFRVKDRFYNDRLYREYLKEHQE